MSLNRKDPLIFIPHAAPGPSLPGSAPAAAPAQPELSKWLHRWALLTAGVTLALVGAGGLVTSHGVGMAVPDWPNTYGYNMFFFPVSQWVGGIFYEHTHRLVASAVGLMTTILALWLYGKQARGFLRWGGVALMGTAAVTLLALPNRWADALVAVVSGVAAFAGSFVWPRGEPAPKWLRRLGLIAFLAVVLQGVLGGLRVILFRDQIGIFHATLAQLFFALVCCLALFTSRWWRSSAECGVRSAERGKIRNLSSADFGVRSAEYYAGERFRTPHSALRTRRWLFVVTTGLILLQLVLGATMRHQHAGLAIPDFPLAYGKLWPATDPGSIALYNQHRIEVTAANPITAFQVVLQMVHRLLAVAILVTVALSAWLSRRTAGAGHALSKLSLAWVGLIVTQALLGAATIWSNKAADVATAHVMVGALSLALGSIVCMVSFRDSVLARQRVELRPVEAAASPLELSPHPAPAGGA